MLSRSDVLLFIKAPGTRNVKSRLARGLGRKLAREAYAHFVADTINRIRRYPLKIFYYPPGSCEAVRSRLGADSVFFPQEGKDLGERMENAFMRSFSDGTEKAVLVGSDIPDLGAEVIDEAFGAMDEKDAVIGPAADGGYYLIGFRKGSFQPAVFHGIRWSSNSVFRDTIEIFGKAGSKVHILPELHDVDTVEDLKALLVRNRDTNFRNSQTMSWAIQNWDRIFQESEKN